MYRCRRLISIVFSLAVVASVFIFSVYADDSVYITIPTMTYTVHDGSPRNFQLASGQSGLVQGKYIDGTLRKWDFTLTNLYRNSSFGSEIPFYYHFRIKFFFAHSGHYTSSLNFSYLTSSYNVYESNTESRQAKFITDYDPLLEPLQDFQYSVACIDVRGVTKKLNNIFDIGIQFSAPANDNTFPSDLYYIIDECVCTMDRGYFMNTLLSDNDLLISYTYDLDYNLCNHDIYSYFSISYAQDGTATTSEVQNIPWYEALLYNIKSLVAPVKEQVEQEQKAKDAGAYDALDDAFDNAGSSFGSLGDFGSVSDIAPFNPGSFDDNAEINILDWFSAETRDNIDTVPRTRANEVQVIDFYHSHINQYLEEVESNDTAD